MLDVSCPFLDRFLETDEQLPRLLPLLFTHPSWLSGDVTRALIRYHLPTTATSSPSG